MIIMLFANRYHGNADPGAIWYAACIELLVEALLASVLVGVVVL